MHSYSLQFSLEFIPMLKRIKIVLLLFLLVGAVKAQPKNEKISRLAEDAEIYMEDEDWDKAYETYDKIIQIDNSNPFFKFRKGVCALRLADKKEETIKLFEEVLKESPEDKIVLHFLGRAYHHNYQFTEAIKYFDEYLASGPVDEQYIDEANQYKTNSLFGINLTKTMVEADIKNLGPPLNTNDNEYVPVISADESMIIYTYKGSKSIGGLQNEKFKKDEHGVYYEDIYISRKNNDSAWSEPESIGENINTNHNDASIALSPDGQELYTFYSDEKNGGDIYVCVLEGDSWSKPVALNSNINTPYWEGSCSITADGKQLFFASERPGGYGKKDLYVSTKKGDGTWGPAENLGPIINTKNNDDDPFIHPDGITLFFSSQGHKSIGGFDIMYSIKKDGKWIEPTNMGYPLNTTDDDRYYVITAKGDRGYFSSDRNSKQSGGHQDIYTVTPGVVGEKPVLAMVIGHIYGNDIPMEASVEIIKKSSGEVIGPFHSNKKTGKYLVALSPGENYTFKIKVATFADYQEDFDIARLHKFVEIRKDFHLVKDGYVDPHLQDLKKLNEMLTGMLDTVTSVASYNKIVDSLKVIETIAAHNDNTHINSHHTEKDTVKQITSTPVETIDKCAAFRSLDFTALKNKSLNDPQVYAKLMAIAEMVSCSKMQFKVQIAAYKKPENYKWDHLKQFGKPEEIAYPDGITRFTQGNFTDLLDAEAQRQKAISKGQKDAWIVGFIDGKRYTLEELIMVDFFNKNITQFNQNLELLSEFIVFEEE